MIEVVLAVCAVLLLPVATAVAVARSQKELAELSAATTELGRVLRKEIDPRFRWSVDRLDGVTRRARNGAGDEEGTDG